MAEYNPYAAPKAPIPAPAAPVHTVFAGVPQPWSTGDVLGIAWSGFKASWTSVFFAQFLAIAIQYVPDLLRGAALGAGLLARGSTEDAAWNAVSSILGIVITGFLNAGLAKIYLKVARGEMATFADLFGGGRRTLAMIGMALAYGIAVGVGFLFFIVPGVIFAIGFQLADFFIVDAHLGAIRSLRASWQVTKGHKAHIFVFNLVSAAVLVAGVFACGVGLFAALAIVRIAEAVIYLRISGRAAPTSPAPMDAPVPMPIA
jgi:hypothetical protein